MPSILPIVRQRRERRLRSQTSLNQRTNRSVLASGLIFSLFLGVLIITSGFFYANLTANLPSIELIPALLNPQNGLLLQPTRIYDRSGNHLLDVLAPQDTARRYVPLDPNDPSHIPNTLSRITVVLKDPQLYQHSGFSWQGLDAPEEHPTLAQQLAADLLLWQEAPSLNRAIRERILAWQLTQAYGPDQILEWYLNSAAYGRYTYGAEAAAQLYFGKPASQLNLAEAAVLAAANEAPAINPLDAPQAAIQRQQEILERLKTLGMASENEINQALAYPLTFRQAPPKLFSASPAVTSLVLAQLENTPAKERIIRGGMKIITSIDYNLQIQSVCATQIQLARLSGVSTEESNCPASGKLSPLPPNLTIENPAASAIVTDPRNGQILALVGETRAGTQAAYTTLGRTGTLLTPFIYLTSFTRGLSPASLVWDIPSENQPFANFNNQYQGPIRLRIALANDYLAPAEQIFNEIGNAAILQTIRPFGLQPASMNTIDEYLNNEQRFSLPAIASAYSIFAAQGVQTGQAFNSQNLSPFIVLQVASYDNVMVLNWETTQTRQVVSPQLAYLINHVLSDESARWPSLGNPNPFEIGLPVAAKSSQTLDGQESWAVGYSTSRTVVVWMGGENIPARVTAGLWAAIMQTASQNSAAEGWSMPAGISRLNVCDPSGQLPTEACPNVVSEIFLNGYEPTQTDTLYQQYSINRETGLLATVFTPPAMLEKRVYINYPPEALNWAGLSGLRTPPTAYDTIQQAPPRADLAILAPAMFDTLSGKIEVVGSASGENFQSYRLQVGQGLNPQNWVLISESQTPIPQGVLGVWDATGQSGLYSIQLVVVRENQLVETTAVQINVEP